jgi:hypothetical protein
VSVADVKRCSKTTRELADLMHLGPRAARRLLEDSQQMGLVAEVRANEWVLTASAEQRFGRYLRALPGKPASPDADFATHRRRKGHLQR